MKIAFELTMPGNNSWNGRWSGEEDKHVVIRDVSVSKASMLRYAPILEKGYYSYSFGDGWRAAITVKEVDIKTARKLKKESRGFCGYEWMIESIIYNGDIRIEPRKQA